MACNVYIKFVLVVCVSWSVSFAVGQPFKAVNLGNWLVTEGWMQPSRFDGIHNKDLLLWRINENTFNFRVFNKQFVGLSQQGSGTGLVAESNDPSNSETFQIEKENDNSNRVRIKANNGCYLQAISEDKVTADFQGSGWEDSNPSVFSMTVLSDKTLRGEYQITNGYGPDRAPQVMQDHWNTYITDDDFRFLSSNGINAVRIPVGWWIAKDPSPPKPYVGGSLKALDNAFTWAEKYGIKVIVDLHAVQGSQNGNAHSSSRDGYLEWGDSYIQDTVDVIDFLAKRYGNNPSLAAIELMNEPVAPGVSLETLKKYYQAGYDAVRKYTSSKFNNMNAQQNIDYINNDRSSQLGALTTSNGPLVFVGEWTGEWKINGASKEDYQRFTKAQLETYGHATFGWAYWAYKCQFDHWSLKWMIEKQYVTL
ncbi:hypothetical protein FEM48_Zijuj08G0165600 [Ziziphus jujuba var. spinosa]|uniref:Mannan endo-1,4-beta-mannosidase n=1 Tax=Ziziphus jujuba var. spinosa TaxID=714518 RepID=A0A978V067_ZIZJJ|nr:hypothetical protein FEM48_Zijuj08G0165600 [Ziziphus jujuba var. spinosa]